MERRGGSGVRGGGERRGGGTGFGGERSALPGKWGTGGFVTSWAHSATRLIIIVPTFIKHVKFAKQCSDPFTTLTVCSVI